MKNEKGVGERVPWCQSHHITHGEVRTNKKLCFQSERVRKSKCEKECFKPGVSNSDSYAGHILTKKGRGPH